MPIKLWGPCSNMTSMTKLETQQGKGISIIVPFHCHDKKSQRIKNWAWLREHWRCVFPLAQIIVGEDPKSTKDPHIPFSKSSAINHAAVKATGDVFVLLDADGYIDSESILLCVKKIRRARERGQRLWFVPYRQFYRLTEKASQKLLKSSPAQPYKFPVPVKIADVQDTSGSQFGHWYGAGIQILPREAFNKVGGWDERFRGWGGEDHGAMRATDTLYWPHKTLPGQFLHVWHPMISSEAGKKSWVHWKDRVWENQISSQANAELSGRYYGAHGHPRRMRKLVDEGR